MAAVDKIRRHRYLCFRECGDILVHAGVCRGETPKSWILPAPADRNALALQPGDLTRSQRLVFLRKSCAHCSVILKYLGMIEEEGDSRPASASEGPAHSRGRHMVVLLDVRHHVVHQISLPSLEVSKTA